MATEIVKGNMIGMDEEKTVIAVHKVFTKAQKEKKNIIEVTITPTCMIYKTVEVESL